MIKKFLCTLITCVMFFNTINYSYATEDVYSGNQTNESALTINELYELRNSLTMNFDVFSEDIALIDKKLESLGVEEISQTEVEMKLGLINDSSVQPCYDVSSTSDIRWTSTREYYVYRGQSYELQVIRGVPISNNSSLIGRYKHEVNKYSSFEANAKNAFKIIVNSIAGCLPNIGGTIVTLQTFYAIFKDTYSSLTPTTLIDSFDSLYKSMVSANYVYVFVKYSGSADEGNQILAYCGNDLQYETTIILDAPILLENGSLGANNDTVELNGTITSPYYNGYRDVASNVFWEYKNGNSNKTIYYDTYKFWVEALDDELCLYAPSAFPS